MIFPGDSYCFSVVLKSTVNVAKEAVVHGFIFFLFFFFFQEPHTMIL